MQYISTRGKADKLGFIDVVIAGLASDGGLYVPESYPFFSAKEITKLRGLSYSELFLQIVRPYIAGAIPDKDLQKIVEASYNNFSHKAIAPLKQIDNQQFLLELFHGPTLAFKDFALQFLGRIFNYILSKKEEKVTIVGATSGDTGSAAIEGCRHSSHVNIFILHPNGRVSDVQRRQMTTIAAKNVNNLAVETDFDGCQNLVKELFADQSFLGGKSRLVAVNSINWCRIMAQIVYYFYAALQLGAPDRVVSFSVPTGNFGDIFAGYVAKKMGLPIEKLIIATNSNDILAKFISSNIYEKTKVVKTLSPSMDIQVSSNFERLLFDLYDNNGNEIANLMNQFNSAKISIDNDKFNKAKETFLSHSCDDETICQIISEIYHNTGELVDPHTATGIKAAQVYNQKNGVPTITLATAHPAKFGQAIKRAGFPEPNLPANLTDLMQRPEYYKVVSSDINEIKSYIVGKSFY